VRLRSWHTLSSRPARPAWWPSGPPASRPRSPPPSDARSWTFARGTAGTARALRELDAWPEVSAALTVVPYYTRPSQDGIIAHFTRLAAGSPVPVIVYNIPYRTGTSVSLGTLRELARIPGIAGVKQAAGGVDHDTVLLLADPPEDFAVLAGDDVFASPLLALGAAGGILASAHLCTSEFAGLIAAWHAGKAARASELGHRLAPLSAALFAEPNPVVIKGVLHAQGMIPSPAVRLPLLPARHDTVHAAMTLLDTMCAGLPGLDAGVTS